MSDQMFQVAYKEEKKIAARSIEKHFIKQATCILHGNIFLNDAYL